MLWASKRRRHAGRLLLTISVCGLLSIAPSLVSAEGFVDFYGGFALGHNTDARFAQVSPTTATVTKRLGFKASNTFGIRGGVWFGDALPWLGLAADLSFFQRKADAADIDLVPLSFLLMLRYPLFTSEQVPKGQLQPYVGIGPSFFYSHTSIDFGPSFGSVNHGSFFGDIGLDARAGLSWQIHKSFGLFWEYRFTYVALDYDQKVCPAQAGFGLGAFSCQGPTRTVQTTELTLNTHHLLVGIRF